MRVNYFSTLKKPINFYLLFIIVLLCINNFRLFNSKYIFLCKYDLLSKCIFQRVARAYLFGYYECFQVFLSNTNDSVLVFNWNHFEMRCDRQQKRGAIDNNYGRQ